MKGLRLIFLLFILSNAIFSVSQVTVRPRDFVNKNTQQWLQDRGSSGGKAGHFYYFILVSKINALNEKEIKIPSSKFNSFVDSIRREGFTSNVKVIDRKKDYSATILLDSIVFKKITGQDSVFSFWYKITLRSFKTNFKYMYSFDREGTERIMVQEALTKKEYDFDMIEEIKETGIIRVGLLSEKLLFPRKNYKSGVFAPWMSICF